MTYAELVPKGAFRVPKIEVKDNRYLQVTGFEYKTYMELANSIKDVDLRDMAVEVVNVTSRGLSAARMMIEEGYWTAADYEDFRAYWSLTNQGQTPGGASKKTMDMLFRANTESVEWFAENLDYYIFWFVTRKCCYIMAQDVAINSYSMTCFFNLLGRWNAVMNMPLMNSVSHNSFGSNLVSGINHNAAFFSDHFYNVDDSDFEWKFRLPNYDGGANDVLNAAAIRSDWNGYTNGEVAFEYYKAMGSFKFYASKTGIPMPTRVVPGTLRDPSTGRNGPLYKALKDHVLRCRDSIYLPYHYITTELRMHLEAEFGLANNTDVIQMYEEDYYDILEGLDYNPNTAQRIAFITPHLYIVEAGTDSHGKQMYAFSTTQPESPVGIQIQLPKTDATLDLVLRGTGLASKTGAADLLITYHELINCCWAYFYRETNYLRSQGAMIMMNAAHAKANARFDFYENTLVSYEGNHYGNIQVDLFDAEEGVSPTLINFDEVALSVLNYGFTQQVIETGSVGFVNLEFGHTFGAITETSRLRMPKSMQNLMKDLLGRFESSMLS